MSAKAWLVDLDGTLYVARWVKLAMAAELALSGWGSVGTLRRFRKEHELLREELDEDVPSPFQAQVERAASALGVPSSEVEQRVTEWMIERPQKWIRRFGRTDLLQEISDFRAQGGKTALVSDYPARGKLAALGAEALFDVVVANGEPGGPPRLKPHPAGYLEAARRLGVAPEACLVIGDRDDADGAAARAAGMTFRRV
ncbi:MAG: HAD-IA family hydrolase [Myxococcales bacterium]|nr:HAD-IA family hydrolase [Myxococcales bacterium]